MAGPDFTYFVPSAGVDTSNLVTSTLSPTPVNGDVLVVKLTTWDTANPMGAVTGGGRTRHHRRYVCGNGAVHGGCPGCGRFEGSDLHTAGRGMILVDTNVLLRQALSNLCRNAFEACDNARVVPKIVIEGHRDQAHGLVRISVSDNGPGIPADVAPRVFRPFFTTKAHGIGLGLALVQKIIVTHNGRITVASDDGGGARFVVTLPAAASEAAATSNRAESISAISVGSPVRRFRDPSR